MFDTMKIAKKIKDARIARNMTQMNLADAMGVSYQAVSNWERGNSMPDISKLEDLCKALNITISELLGMEETKTASAVNKVMKEEELSVEELAEVAPILPPEQMGAHARRTAGKDKKFNIKILAEIAPFMDGDLLEELIGDIQVDSLKELAPLAPFLEEGVLDQLVRKAQMTDVQGLSALAPFLDEDTIDWVVRQCDAEVDKNLIGSLAPFMDEDTIDALVDMQITKGNVKALTGLYPFMETDTVRKVAKALMESGDIDELKNAAVFL